MVAVPPNAAPLGTDANVYQMLKLGAITSVVMLILGILAAGSEFRHRTIVPALLATPSRGRIFAVKVAVIAGLGAAFSAVIFGLGLGTVVLELSAHGIHHLPAGIGGFYVGTVIASACFGMIGVALGALTRNTIGAIVAAITWALFIETVILHAVAPGIEKWLPTGAATGLTNAPGPGHSLTPAVAGTVLTGYAIVLLLAAIRTTMRRDVA
jgi:ABC-2 type transport system permease protein